MENNDMPAKEPAESAPDLIGTATYDPGDNKIRITAFHRLPRELYDRVKAAGFSWAPKQEIFVAPMWTPDREDLAVELCGELGDEDKSLVDRAEERAERFDGYSERRADDAERARAGVAAIADNIPMGQPILVGHHSEKHARRDAERIESGMRKAVKMWETSQYWIERAKGALRHAKYKEYPDVRARRIKKIEADRRKIERTKADSASGLRFWRGEMKLKNQKSGEVSTCEISESNRERIHGLMGGVVGITCGEFYVAPRDAGGGWSPWEVLKTDDERYKACPSRTVEECRQAAERAFTRRIARCDRWLAHYDNRLTYERTMLADSGGTVADKTGPEKGGACKCWASHRGGWSYIVKVNKVTVSLLDNWGNSGDMDGSRNFTRTIPFDKLSAVMTAAEVQSARDAGRLVEFGDKTGFMLAGSSPRQAPPEVPKAEPPEDKGADFAAMRESLKAGVKVVTAPQLFPTPPELAARMVELAEILPGHRVLEPSAGTGAIIRAIPNNSGAAIVAVEINGQLAEALENPGGLPSGIEVIRGDFLQCNGDLGLFDRVLMNPPFVNGSDVLHIRHALNKLKPGGKLVAICAGGPKQKACLEPLADLWEPLPAGTFADQGTNVNTVLLVIEKRD